MMRKTTVLLAAAVLAAAVARGAQAQTLQVDFNTGLTGVLSVNFNDQAKSLTAGAFLLTLTGGGPDYASPFSFHGFCVDIESRINNGDSYDVDLLPVPTSLGANSGRIAWLYNMMTPGIVAGNNLNEALALQVALWELVYDSTDSLTGGNFKYSSNTTIASLASAYLSQSVGMSDTAMLLAARNHPVVDGLRRNQDMIGPAPTPTEVIPEPATCALLASGLLPLAGIARRRKKAQ